MRYCHEKAVEAMFTVNDVVLEKGEGSARSLKTNLPLNLCVLDLGGGLRLTDPTVTQIEPFQIASVPFQALWRGINHPGVSWRREVPASFSDLASVMATTLTPQEYVSRPLGQKSYLLAAEEYMNLNARLAFHFTLVDASLTNTPQQKLHRLSIRGRRDHQGSPEPPSPVCRRVFEALWLHGGPKERPRECMAEAGAGCTDVRCSRYFGTFVGVHEPTRHVHDEPRGNEVVRASVPGREL